jgi:hypothetical protein
VCVCVCDVQVCYDMCIPNLPYLSLVVHQLPIILKDNICMFTVLSLYILQKYIEKVEIFEGLLACSVS